MTCDGVITSSVDIGKYPNSRSPSPTWSERDSTTSPKPHTGTRPQLHVVTEVGCREERPVPDHVARRGVGHVVRREPERVDPDADLAVGERGRVEPDHLRGPVVGPVDEEMPIVHPANVVTSGIRHRRRAP